jgi:hypothetical protein
MARVNTKAPAVLAPFRRGGAAQKQQKAMFDQHEERIGQVKKETLKHDTWIKFWRDS